MTAQYILNVENILRNDMKSEFIMLGQEDVTPCCSCENCIEAMEKYKNHAGLQIVFANKVAKAVDEWLAVNQPGRKISYVIYAYHETLGAPIDSAGKPICEEVIPRDNVIIMYTPMGMNFAYSIFDDKNATFGRNLLDWQSLCTAGNIMIYSYCINFNAYFMNFDNYDSLQSNYRIYADNNVSYLFEQGPLNANTPAFQELKIYAMSRMMWDASQNYEEVVRDFILHYY